jgi:ribosomal protein S18 acetylase RimI-like enzyme
MRDKIRCITQGMEYYFRTFALADTVCLHETDISWISPKPNFTGPSIVFRVSLDEKTIENRLVALAADLATGVIPSLWVVTPLSTPANVLDHLKSIGFEGETNFNKPEPGMALDIDEFPLEPGINSDIEIKKVETLVEFSLWVDVVNEALHGWKLLSTEHYSSWLHYPPLVFYLGCRAGKPIATLATIQDGELASVEFVSTLKEYRRQGAATALCTEAIKDLRSQGVKTVTLRSSTQAISMYAKIGFKPYFELRTITYPRDRDTKR